LWGIPGGIFRISGREPLLLASPTEWTVFLVRRQALGSEVPLKLSFPLKLSESFGKFPYVAGQWKGIMAPSAE
jgi:hypothetical protein